MVKIWLTAAARSTSRPGMSLAHTFQRLVIRKGRLSVLAAALMAAVCLTACSPSPPVSHPPSVGPQTPGPYVSPTDPYASPSESPAGPSAPPGGTNHCAFAGDPLCPGTPIVLPPPLIGDWS
jgi:hypothetical protein